MSEFKGRVFFCDQGAPRLGRVRCREVTFGKVWYTVDLPEGGGRIVAEDGILSEAAEALTDDQVEAMISLLCSKGKC